MTAQSSQSLVPELAVVNGKVVVTSLHVAEVFEKRHDHVLRDIGYILTQLVDSVGNPKIGGIGGNPQVDDSFGKLNFEPSEYTIVNNLGHSVNKPMYLLARDGFTLLAMGFTGKRALEFKIAYINAFNAMEQALLDRPSPPVLSGREYVEIRRLVDCIEQSFHMKGGAQVAANAALRQRLGIASVRKIPVERRAEALSVLAALEKEAFAFKSKVIDCERAFFRSRFGEIPPELLAAAHEADNLPATQPPLTF